MEMGFVKQDDDAKIVEGINQCAEIALHLPIPTPESTETEDVNIWSGVSNSNAVSISMPTTPIGHTPLRTSFVDNSKASLDLERGLGKFYCQSMSKSVAHIETSDGVMDKNIRVRNPGLSTLRDNRFDSFKTWSGKLERQLSHIRGKPVEEGPQEHKHPHGNHEDRIPVGRYFAALEGPELETLRPSEELMLPKDKKWPFLLRYPISSFGICLGVSSQAILWKNLATSHSTSFLHVSPIVNMVLWCISIVLVVIVSFIYALKLIFYFEAVRREYYHPIRVNFFFAPFIALLFLALGVPPTYSKHLHQSLWYVLMTPFLILELKIYGQWMSGGQRRLSKVANPSNHIAIVGNFVGALLGASMGLKEGPIFFFAVGLAHYTVLFVTLYQRLPTNDTLPKELHPVFFLFVAAPNVACMAWAKINGSFDSGARLGYFIALFLYFSLAVRINFFRGFKFSLAWWAYTFPMTGAAIATIKYTEEVTNWVTRSLVITLSGVATLVVIGLLITTLIHAFVLGDLFPNDIAIAISDVAPKPTRKKWFQLRNGILQSKDTESYLKFGCFQSNNGIDLEASVGNSSSYGQDQSSCIEN